MSSAVLMEGATQWSVANRAADAVSRALTFAGVPHFAVHQRFTATSMWSVRHSDIDRVFDTLQIELGPHGYLLSAGSIRSRPLLRGLTGAERNRVRVCSVYQMVTDPLTGQEFAEEAACEIHVWMDNGAGRLIAPTRNAIIQDLDSGEPWEIVRAPRWDGAEEPRLLRTVGVDMAEIGFPVDAVYLWVDDSDLNWRRKREEVRVRLGMEPESEVEDETVAAHRFRDRGELRASLRSLEMFAPWIRHIYLVTDDQRPHWLDTTSSRITVVDHKEIFEDPSVLPTYNSHAIGSQLHRISGLSDRYLLINDDVLFTKPVSPYDFFTPLGQLRVSFSKKRRPSSLGPVPSPVEVARKRTADILEKKYGRRVESLFAHVPVPQLKSVAAEIADEYRSEVCATAAAQFRAESDLVVNSWLHLYTALFSGRAVVSNLKFGYVNVGDPVARAKLDDPKFLERFSTLCVNDVPPPGGEPDEDSSWLSTWLIRMFPRRSQFEIRNQY